MMGVEMEDLPDQMSLAALAERCQREIANFRKGEVFNDRYCLEIFYRAITRQDNGAWELLTRSFRRMVVGWLRNHPLRESAMRYESEENFVDLAFTRFWRATRNQAVVFHSLAAALTYLKASLHGELQDTIRAHVRQVPVVLVLFDHDDPRLLGDQPLGHLSTDRAEADDHHVPAQPGHPAASERLLDPAVGFLLVSCEVKAAYDQVEDVPDPIERVVHLVWVLKDRLHLAAVGNALLTVYRFRRPSPGTRESSAERTVSRVTAGGFGYLKTS